MKKMSFNNIVEEKIRNIIVDKKLIQKEVDFQDDLVNLGLNSIKMVELVVYIEDMFQFEFSLDDLKLENFKSIETLSKIVIGHIEK